MARDQHFHLPPGFLVRILALDKDLVDLACIQIADRALDQIAFLMDQAWCLRFQRLGTDFIPQFGQIGIVAGDLGLGPLGTGRPHDDSHAILDIEAANDRLQPLPVGSVGDLAADTAAPRRVRHQHTIATGERQVGRQRRTLVAAFLLDDLHQHDLLAGYHFLDFVSADLAAWPDVVFIGTFAANGLRHAVGFLRAVLILVRVTLCLNKRLAVLDRDAVVIRVDFAECQEPLTIAAIFNKGGLKRGFDPRYARQIYVALELLAVFGLVVEILNSGAAQQDDPCLFGLSAVDK